MPDTLRTAELARKRGGPSGDAAAIPRRRRAAVELRIGLVGAVVAGRRLQELAEKGELVLRRRPRSDRGHLSVQSRDAVQDSIVRWRLIEGQLKFKVQS